MSQNASPTIQDNNYLTPGWITLFATAIVITLIFVFFTPYTHQLDEIKNVFLMMFPPFLLGATVLQKDFSKISWKNDSPTMFCGLWVLAMVCSYIVNPYKLTGERVVWFQMSCLTFTLVFAWLMNTEEKLRKVMIFMTSLCFVSVLFGLFFFAGRGFTDEIYNWLKADPQFRRDYQEWVTLFYTLKESRQMYSTILNEDFYGAFLVMTTAIPLAMFFVERDRILMRLFALCTFLLMNVCIVFTNSNDSYSATILILYPLFFGLGWAYVKHEEWGVTRSVVYTFLIGSAVLAVTICILQSPKIMQTWEFKSEALEGRKILWSGGLLPWLKGTDGNNPHFSMITGLFGTGPGGYRFYFPVWRNPFWFDNQINNVTTFGHNWYFDVLLEFGLFGLLSFFGLHIMVLVRGIRQIARTTVTSHKFYQIALISGLCAVALQNFFSPNNRWAVAGMIYWSLFGLSMGISMLDYNPDDDADITQQPRSRIQFANGIKYAALVLCVIFIVCSVPQGVNYWKSAKYNAEGIRAMDTAQYFAQEKMEEEQIKELTKAQNLLRKATILNPTFATSYYKLGHVVSNIGKTEDAIKTYEELNTVFPHYSELDLNLGILYFTLATEEKTTSEEQIANLEKSWSFMQESARQSMKPGVQYYASYVGMALANAYDSLQKPEQAKAVREKIKQYQKNLIEYKPRLPEFQNDKKAHYAKTQINLLMTCEETSDTQGSIDILKKMYFEKPENRRLLSMLMTKFANENHTSDAMNFFKEAIDNAPIDPYLRQLHGEMLQKSGKLAEAQTELKLADMLTSLTGGSRQTSEPMALRENASSAEE